MVQNLVSPEYYANLVQKHGKAGADAILRKEGWRVDVPEPDFTPVGAPIAPASPTGGLGGGTGMDGDDDNEGRGEDALPVGGLSYADAQREAAAANQGLYGQIQSNISVLDAAREALRNRRFAPSNSEKWLAIAAALGQPTRTGSFGESLGNLAQALAAQKAELRKDQREADLLGLKYGLEAGTERIRLAQARATEADRTLRAAATAAAKAEAAKQPKYDYSEGEYALRPGTGDMPPMNGRGQFVVSTRKQALNVPRGKEFVMENDPSGKVYYGQ